MARILIMEDNLDYCEQFRGLNLPLNVEVTIVSTYEEALELAMTICRDENAADICFLLDGWIGESKPYGKPHGQLIAEQLERDDFKGVIVNISFSSKFQCDYEVGKHVVVEFIEKAYKEGGLPKFPIS